MKKNQCPFCYEDCVDWRTCQRLRCNHDQKICQKDLYCQLTDGTRKVCNTEECKSRLQEYVNSKIEHTIKRKIEKFIKFLNED